MRITALAYALLGLAWSLPEPIQAVTAQQAYTERNAVAVEAFATVGDVIATRLIAPGAAALAGQGLAGHPLVKAPWRPEFTLGLAVAHMRTNKELAGPADQQNTGRRAVVSKLPPEIVLPQAVLQMRMGIPAFWLFDSAEVGLEAGGLEAGPVKLGRSGLQFRGSLVEQGFENPYSLVAAAGVRHGTVDIFFPAKVEPVAVTYTATDSTPVWITGEIGNAIRATARVDVFHLDALFSKRMAAFTPYGGASLQANLGEAQVVVTEAGSIQLDGGPSMAHELSGGKKVPLPPMEARVLAGFSLDGWGIMFVLGGEYAVMSGQAGVQAQLGYYFR